MAADISDRRLECLLDFLSYVGDERRAFKSEIALPEWVGSTFTVRAAQDVVGTPFLRLEAAQVFEAIHIRAMEENDEARTVPGIVTFRNAQKVTHPLPRRLEETGGAGLDLGRRIELGWPIVLCRGACCDAQDGERRESGLHEVFR